MNLLCGDDDAKYTAPAVECQWEWVHQTRPAKKERRITPRQATDSPRNHRCIDTREQVPKEGKTTIGAYSLPQV